MKISVLCNDGSPLGTHYSDIMGLNGRIGLGGAEQALHMMCNYWHEQGHDVTLFNNPSMQDGSPYEQRNINTFQRDENRDVLIIFRSPNQKSYGARGKKIWWSCDQRTSGDFKSFAPSVDKIVTISPRHANYFRDFYGITDTVTVDLPVRLDDYRKPVTKDNKQLIFCSIPDRGLLEASKAFKLLMSKVDDVKLVVTSSWSLWDGRNHDQHLLPYRLALSKLGDRVDYRGGIRRDELVTLQLQSGMHFYPSTYDELYCISAAECQVAGAFPLTSDVGALATTNMGRLVPGHPSEPEWIEKYVDAAVGILNSPNLVNMQDEVRMKAVSRFDINVIGEAWETNVFCS